MSWRKRIAAVAAVLALAGTAGIVVTMVNGPAENSPAAAVAVPDAELATIREAARSCRALSGPRLAGQIMEASHFSTQARDNRGGQGMAGLTDAIWAQWAPWSGATRAETKASIVGLAHYMCDLIGQVRVAGVTGDPWQLGLAAHVSGVNAVQSANGIPATARSYVDAVNGYAAWYAARPEFGGQLASSPSPDQVPTLEATPTPTPEPQLSASTPPPAATSTPPANPLKTTPPGPPPAIPPQAPLPPKGPGLVSKDSGKCLSSSKATDGTQLMIWDCDGSMPQQWSFESDGTIRSVGLCMDLADAGTVKGTRVQVARCNSRPSQLFRLTTNGYLYSPYANRCLDVVNYGRTNGTLVIIFNCNNTSNQLWTLR